MGVTSSRVWHWVRGYKYGIRLCGKFEDNRSLFSERGRVVILGVVCMGWGASSSLWHRVQPLMIWFRDL